MSAKTVRELQRWMENVHLARSVAATFRPQVVLNAFRAASTALSTSSEEAAWKSSRCSPVAGLTVENVSPFEEGTNSLLLRG